MATWVYKCNSRQHPDQVAYGDWADFFAGGAESQWGSTEWVPALTHLERGDTVIAYQTDRNEIVGLAEVVRLARRGKQFRDLILRPVEQVGAKVRPLKEADSTIASIPALRPGRIQTLYEISDRQAARLLRAARAAAKGTPPATAAQLKLRGIDQIRIALECMVRNGGYATTAQIYEAVEWHLDGRPLSKQGRDTLRSLINREAVNAKLVQDFVKGQPGWRITALGRRLVAGEGSPANGETEAGAADELEGLEGEERRRMITHRHRERGLRERKIADAMSASDGRLACEVPGCGFDFQAAYGKLGGGYAQVHHKRALSSGEGTRTTRLSDLAVICANCHVMIHKGGACRSLDGLRLG